MNVTIWTPELDAALRRLWHEGLSASRIGARMSLTKNSVIGRVHRLRLPARSSPLRVPRAPGYKRERRDHREFLASLSSDRTEEAT